MSVSDPLYRVGGEDTSGVDCSAVEGIPLEILHLVIDPSFAVESGL